MDIVLILLPSHHTTPSSLTQSRSSGTDVWLKLSTPWPSRTLRTRSQGLDVPCMTDRQKEWTHTIRCLIYSLHFRATLWARKILTFRKRIKGLSVLLSLFVFHNTLFHPRPSNPDWQKWVIKPLKDFSRKSKEICFWTSNCTKKIFFFFRSFLIREEIYYCLQKLFPE